MSERISLDRAIPGRPDSVNRADNDFYRTPRNAIEPLLEAERFSGTVWEPACGDGAISDVLLERGFAVSNSDLIDYGYRTTMVLDFLDRSFVPRPKMNNVITNPPFKLAQAFAERALEVTDGKVALLCRLLWLSSKRRREFFVRSPLARVWVFPSRINFNRDNEARYQSGTGGMVDFCWFVWDHSHHGAPEIRWLP